jgi:hypothetical protein
VRTSNPKNILFLDGPSKNDLLALTLVTSLSFVLKVGIAANHQSVAWTQHKHTKYTYLLAYFPYFEK